MASNCQSESVEKSPSGVLLELSAILEEKAGEFRGLAKQKQPRSKSRGKGLKTRRLGDLLNSSSSEDEGILSPPHKKRPKQSCAGRRGMSQ